MKCCYVENCSIATESDPRRPSEQPSLSEHCPVHSYLDLIPYLATTLKQKLRVTTLLSWEPTYFATFSMCCLSSSISFDMAACIHVEWCRYPVVGTNDVTFVFKRVELHVIAWSVCHQHKDTYMHIVFSLVRIYVGVHANELVQFCSTLLAAISINQYHEQHPLFRLQIPICCLTP